MIPRVSVIIATYNYGKYITDCLESLRNQSFKNFETIIVDDGSTDNTADIVKEFADDRIRYFFQVNQGQATAKNIGIKVSLGEFLCFLDSDDYIDEKNIEERVLFLDTHNDIDWAFTDTYFVDASKNILDKGSEVFSVIPDDQFLNNVFYQLLALGNFITSDTVMMRRHCIESIGYFHETLRFHEDYELWLRLAQKFRCGYIHQPLNFMRKHQQSLGTENYERDRAGMLKFMDYVESIYPNDIKSIRSIWQNRRADAWNHLGQSAYNRFEHKASLIYFMNSIKSYPLQIFAYKKIFSNLSLLLRNHL